MADSSRTKSELDVLWEAIQEGETMEGQACSLLDKYVNKTHLLEQKRGKDGDSLLHVAARFHKSAHILEKLLAICPELNELHRSGEFEGQTALHVLISKENEEGVRVLLSQATTSQKLLCANATGTRFQDTVMMGQLPLSVAALTLNQDMVDVLLEHGADLSLQNSRGDTVLHSLVRYAHAQSDKTDDVVEMIEFVQEKLLAKFEAETQEPQKNMSTWNTIFLIENDEKMTPLKLSAFLGMVTIFNAILNLEGVYCTLDEHDGLYDIYQYDITEIDPVTQVQFVKQREEAKAEVSTDVCPACTPRFTWTPKQPDKAGGETKSTQLICFHRRYREATSQSVLELICSVDFHCAFELVKVEVVRDVIRTKWQGYKAVFFAWWLVHSLLTGLLAASAVSRWKLADCRSSNTTSTRLKTADSCYEDLDMVFVYLSCLLAIIYGSFLVLLECIRYFYFQQALHLKLLYHNGPYRIVLFLFSLSLIVDSTWFLFDRDNNYILMLAILLGSWFCTFFLRAIKKFSFFCFMFLKVLFGDIIRLSVFIAIELVSFSWAMYVLFLTTDRQPKTLSTFPQTLMAMFKLMLGLEDLESLYEPPQSWLAVLLFVLFVVITYVLLINSLIAMMSMTCSFVSQDRYALWALQRLSIILLLETMVPSSYRPMAGEGKIVRRYNANAGRVTEEKRFYRESRSVQAAYSDGRAINSRRDLLRTQGFESLTLAPPVIHHTGTRTTNVRRRQHNSQADMDRAFRAAVPMARYLNRFRAKARTISPTLATNPQPRTMRGGSRSYDEGSILSDVPKNIHQDTFSPKRDSKPSKRKPKISSVRRRHRSEMIRSTVKSPVSDNHSLSKSYPEPGAKALATETVAQSNSNGDITLVPEPRFTPSLAEQTSPQSVVIDNLGQLPSNWTGPVLLYPVANYPTVQPTSVNMNSNKLSEPGALVTGIPLSSQAHDPGYKQTLLYVSPAPSARAETMTSRHLTQEAITMTSYVDSPKRHIGPATRILNVLDVHDLNTKA